MYKHATLTILPERAWDLATLNFLGFPDLLDLPPVGLAQANVLILHLEVSQGEYLLHRANDQDNLLSFKAG